MSNTKQRRTRHSREEGSSGKPEVVIMSDENFPEMQAQPNEGSIQAYPLQEDEEKELEQKIQQHSLQALRQSPFENEDEVVHTEEDVENDLQDVAQIMDNQEGHHRRESSLQFSQMTNPYQRQSAFGTSEENMRFPGAHSSQNPMSIQSQSQFHSRGIYDDNPYQDNSDLFIQMQSRADALGARQRAPPSTSNFSGQSSQVIQGSASVSRGNIGGIPDGARNRPVEGRGNSMMYSPMASSQNQQYMPIPNNFMSPSHNSMKGRTNIQVSSERNSGSGRFDGGPKQQALISGRVAGFNPEDIDPNIVQMKSQSINGSNLPLTSGFSQQSNQFYHQTFQPWQEDFSHQSRFAGENKSSPGGSSWKAYRQQYSSFGHPYQQPNTDSAKYQQLYYNLNTHFMETIKFVSEQYGVDEDSAFQYVIQGVMAEDKDPNQPLENPIVVEVLESLTQDWQIRDFMQAHTERLIKKNQEYLDLKQQKEKLMAELEALESEEQVEGQPFFMHDPREQQDVVQVTMVNADISEDQNEQQLVGSQSFKKKEENSGSKKLSFATGVKPMLKVYVYIDDIFQYKTQVYGQSSKPIIDVRLGMVPPEDAKTIRFDVYDASHLSHRELNILEQKRIQYERDNTTLSDGINDDEDDLNDEEMEEELEEQQDEDSIEKPRGPRTATKRREDAFESPPVYEDQKQSRSSILKTSKQSKARDSSRSSRSFSSIKVQQRF